MGVRGANPPCIRKSCVTYRQPSVFMVAHSWIQPTTDLVVAVFTAEESSRICEPTQFKLVLFKGQLWLVTHSFQGEETHHTMKGHTGKNQGQSRGRRSRGKTGSRCFIVWDFPRGPVLRLCVPNAGVPGSIPGRSPCQINKIFKQT